MPHICRNIHQHELMNDKINMLLLEIKSACPAMLTSTPAMAGSLSGKYSQVHVGAFFGSLQSKSFSGQDMNAQSLLSSNTDRLLRLAW